MPTNEKQFQTQLRLAMQDQGCHVFKISDRFRGGIPDLYVKHPDYPSVFIELKFRKSANIALGLSQLQRRFIAKEQKHGGKAGWCCCVTEGSTDTIYVSTDWNSSHPRDGQIAYIRGRGEKHQHGAILQILTG